MKDNRHSDERLGDSVAGDPVGDPDGLNASEEKSGAEPIGAERSDEKGDLLGAVGRLANVVAFGKLSDASPAAATADGTLPSDPDDDGTGGTVGARRS